MTSSCRGDKICKCPSCCWALPESAKVHGSAARTLVAQREQRLRQMGKEATVILTKKTAAPAILSRLGPARTPTSSELSRQLFLKTLSSLKRPPESLERPGPLRRSLLSRQRLQNFREGVARGRYAPVARGFEAQGLAGARTA